MNLSIASAFWFSRKYSDDPNTAHNDWVDDKHGSSLGVGKSVKFWQRGQESYAKRCHIWKRYIFSFIVGNVFYLFSSKHIKRVGKILPFWNYQQTQIKETWSGCHFGWTFHNYSLLCFPASTKLKYKLSIFCYKVQEASDVQKLLKWGLVGQLKAVL